MRSTKKATERQCIFSREGTYLHFGKTPESGLGWKWPEIEEEAEILRTRIYNWWTSQMQG